MNLTKYENDPLMDLNNTVFTCIIVYANNCLEIFASGKHMYPETNEKQEDVNTFLCSYDV